MDMCFILKNMGRVERHILVEFVLKGSTSNEFEVDYYEKLEEVIELQYHNEQNRVFLFKCYWYDTTDRGIRLLHYGLVKIISKARLRNVNDVFCFCQAMPTSLLHIHFFL